MKDESNSTQDDKTNPFSSTASSNTIPPSTKPFRARANSRRLSVQIPMPQQLMPPPAFNEKEAVSPTIMKLRRPMGSTVSTMVQSWVNWPVSPGTWQERSPLPSPNLAASEDYAMWQTGRVVRSQWFRTAFFLYAAVSLLVTTIQIMSWVWTSSSNENNRLVENYASPRVTLERTYDANETYSLLTDFSNSYRLSKMFSKALPETLKDVEPFYLRADTSPPPEDITVTLVVQEQNLPLLISFAKEWQGPISVLFTVETEEGRRNLDENIQQLRRNVDVHLMWDHNPPSLIGLRPPLNLRRNIARLFARTEFVAQFADGVWPVTDFRESLNDARVRKRLRGGDLFVLPTFEYTSNATVRNVPQSKGAALRLVQQGHLALHERWEHGTSLEKWSQAQGVYRIENFDLHYNPSVVMSKELSHWCPERINDHGAACLYGAYLSGSDFWVLPNDFMVHINKPVGFHPTFADSEVEAGYDEKMYQRYLPELCMHHARRLHAIKLWHTSRSRHCKTQCGAVLRSWGKGLFDKHS
ncbi:uncharacterized protein VTP21DRAFT_4976 [Calcarisporiella thermophila]|uniref:uncharacterized protein n=1 Tax=Calcarisporiella thermophila TaxID=911321 RepID=UPI00374275DB